MKKILLIVLALSMLLSLCACGGNDTTSPSTEDSSTTQAAETPNQEETIEDTTSNEETSNVPEDTTPVIDVTELSVGDTLSTEFVEMTFEEVVVAEDIQYSVTTGSVTRWSGPDPVAGQQYICYTGKIKNISTSSLPVYDFFTGDIDIDGYTSSVDANDCDILDSEGAPVSTIDPLMEYVFRIYTAIPNDLAANYTSSTFHFGFYDSFDNAELAKNKAFEEDPTSLCPYQYIVTSDATSQEKQNNEDTSTEGEENKSLWETYYYVDNFNQPAEDGYIMNSTNFIGKFNNSATTGSNLLVNVVVDKTDISFFLYEYGKNLVKNSSSSYDDLYNITMRTSDGTDISFTGTMFCGGDRIFVDTNYIPNIISALSQEGNEMTSFYIENAERTTTNYLFTVLSNNFAEQYETLMN